MLKLYKHINCTDTAIEVLRLTKIKDKLVLKVSWYNVVNPKSKFKLGVTETIKIPTKDWKNWKLVLN